MVNFGPITAENCWRVWAGKFQRVSSLGSVTARYSSSRRQPNFAALNRGRHLYYAWRPSRWALAHISSLYIFVGKVSLIRKLQYRILEKFKPTTFTSDLTSLVLLYLQGRTQIKSNQIKFILLRKHHI